VLPAVGWIVCSLAFLLRFHGALLAGLALVDLGAFGAGALLLRRAYRRAQLELVDGRVRYVNALRARIMFRDSPPARVVITGVNWGRLSSRRSRLWLLVDAAGEAEISLNIEAWDRDQLEELRTRLALPLSETTTPLRPSAIRRDFPGAVPWFGAHPYLMSYLILACLVGLVMVARG
jgi:hypothetical protein